MANLIETFTLLKGVAKLDFHTFFKLSVKFKVREHTYKIVIKKFLTINVRNHSVIIELRMHETS